jgi:serine/threonine protein kinase
MMGHLQWVHVSGAVVGTRGYMAPEQEKGQKVGKEADIYSLGVLLAELATGQRPEPDTFVARGSALQRFLPLSQLPRPLAKFILRCTDVRSTRRYRDGQAVLKEFRRLLEG